MHNKPAFALLLSAAVLATLSLTGCKDSTPPPQQQGQAPKVGVVTLTAQPYTLNAELPGRTAPYRVAEVRPQVDGIITKRLFKEGSEIKEGQQLYQIDPAVYQAALKSAQASVASSRTLAERYGLLVKERAVSQQAYDEANAARLAAEAALDRAQIDLRYTRVLAPISGRIGRSNVSEGALVSRGQAQSLAVIQQLDPIYVDVTQSASELIRLRREMASGLLEKTAGNSVPVSLTLPDGSVYGHEGRLEFSEVSVDQGTGSVTLRAVFPNPQHELLPGMFVKAQLPTASKSDAILAPQQGVARTPRGEATALVVDKDNKVELRTLKAERTAGSFWLVSEGLVDGDRLITEGLQFIRPGVVVQVTEATNVPALSAEPAQQ